MAHIRIQLVSLALGLFPSINLDISPTAVGKMRVGPSSGGALARSIVVGVLSSS